MPLQMASDARIFGLAERNAYQTDLDAFAGNSGSPVFHADTFDLVGIFVRGPKKALKVDPTSSYLTDNIQEGPGAPGEGEHVQLIRAPLLALKEHL